MLEEKLFLKKLYNLKNCRQHLLRCHTISNEHLTKLAKCGVSHWHQSKTFPILLLLDGRKQMMEPIHLFGLILNQPHHQSWTKTANAQQNAAEAVSVNPQTWDALGYVHAKENVQTDNSNSSSNRLVLIYNVYSYMLFLICYKCKKYLWSWANNIFFLKKLHS